MTNDLITNHPKPLAYILLSTKDEECYELALRAFKELLTNHGTRKINLEGVTLDFELGLINAVKKIFPSIKIIGCLFHLKNSLWRWARSNKLGNKGIIDQTSQVIDKIVVICWNPAIFDRTLSNLRSKFLKNKELTQFFDYVEENYKDHFSSKMLDYSEINQQTRANSCLEAYHNHLQQLMPRKPTWFELVEALKKEEYRVFSEQIEKERKGEFFSSSSNFGSKFIPRWAKNKLARSESPSKGKSPRNTFKRANSVKQRQKSKIRKEERQIKTKTKNKKTKEKQIKRKATTLKRKSGKNYERENLKRTKKDSNVSLPEQDEEFEPIQSFQNSNNSCRYDSFLNFFYFSIYNSRGNCFTYDQILIPQELMNLFIVCDKMVERTDLETLRNDFWKVLYDNAIDKNDVGNVGFITDLFSVFDHVLDFRLIYSEQKYCTDCKHVENNRITNQKSIIPIPNQFRNKTFPQSYLNLFKQRYYTCPKCFSKKFKINKTIVQEPRYLVLLDDSFDANGSSGLLTLTPRFENNLTKNTFELIAAINIPFRNHYNVLLKDPFLTFQKEEKGYYLHDGLIGEGKILQLKTHEIVEIKPYISVYKIL